MQRFQRTLLFFPSETLPKDASYRYGFTVTETRFAGPKATIQFSEECALPDPLNPHVFDGLSVLELPAAPLQRYVTPNDSVPHGKVTATSFNSAKLNEDRTITLYMPPGYDGNTPSDLLVVFGGGTYGGSPASLMPAPAILDKLIVANKIGPTVAILVNNIGRRNRDLGDYAYFSDFLALELIPWVRAHYRIKDGPSHMVLAGSSRGGVAASHCAFYHPDVVGNVLSRSGAFFVRNEDPNPPPWPITPDSGNLILPFRGSPRLPIKFHLEVGRFDSLLHLNRKMRDVLILKGYPVTDREFDGGQDYFYWRGSLADGLTALFGQN